jgi:hypothetical protein
LRPARHMSFTPCCLSSPKSPARQAFVPSGRCRSASLPDCKAWWLRRSLRLPWP